MCVGGGNGTDDASAVTALPEKTGHLRASDGLVPGVVPNEVLPSGGIVSRGRGKARGGARGAQAWRLHGTVGSFSILLTSMRDRLSRASTRFSCKSAKKFCLKRGRGWKTETPSVGMTTQRQGLWRRQAHRNGTPTRGRQSPEPQPRRCPPTFAPPRAWPCACAPRAPPLAGRGRTARARGAWSWL